jgi:hypothetical protein
MSKRTFTLVEYVMQIKDFSGRGIGLDFGSSGDFLTYIKHLEAINFPQGTSVNLMWPPNRKNEWLQSPWTAIIL